jgi:hypothetical protein
VTALLGPLVVLVALLGVLRVAVGGWRNPRRPRRRLERPPRWLWPALAWVPIGHALASLLGDGPSLGTVVLLSAGFAVAHRAVPGPIELAIGVPATLVSLVEAVTGAGCTPPLGITGMVLVGVFGIMSAVFGLTSALGTGAGRVGERVVLLCALVDLTAFAVQPGGLVLVEVAPLGGQAVLVLLLGVAFLAGFSPKVASGAAGAALVIANASLAIGASVCTRSATWALVGGATFALTRLACSSRRVRRVVGLR